MTRETGPVRSRHAPTIRDMADHHRPGDDTPMYGAGPGSPYPPLAGDPYATAGWPRSYQQPSPALTPLDFGSGSPRPAQPQLPRSERFQELLLQMSEQVSALGATLGEMGECFQQETQVRDDERDPLDLTAWDHLVENTPKDDPYGADRDLREPAQTWNGEPTR